MLFKVLVYGYQCGIYSSRKLEEACRDIVLNCVHFVVPEALDPAGAQDSICNARSFRARVLANYVDTDYVCCDADVLIS